MRHLNVIDLLWTYSGLSNKHAARLFLSEEFFLTSRLLEITYQSVKKRDGRNPYLVPSRLFHTSCLLDSPEYVLTFLYPSKCLI